MDFRSILELLEKDARLNARDLADILHEDEKDVYDAVRSLEEEKSSAATIPSLTTTKFRKIRKFLLSSKSAYAR
ncbi:hypothetical protein [Allobaculum sp. Allo2]|uniref:hypothetical protein n=1 Tax=Allobaculum sp. Allo2 TaxID=2853432 RepID=UPI001F61678B|nr:hypothetical protein [Allobaculum sp. Allo2]